ncbi:DAK2 domain-containing protein [Rhodospirillaceae bacterium SYSU D60014]|uniref:DAK2 domain-containing protein n=1 Tax=Virgifigura deserti TaxID=2268457 RepID=UPI000E670E11
MALTAAVLKPALERWAARLKAVAPELNELDGALGDGDLGATLAKCAANVEGILPDLPDDLSGAFRACALACSKASGSSFGTLLAVAFQCAAKESANRSELPWRELPALLESIIRTLAARGGAQLGDKTVLDALEAARLSLATLDDPKAQHLAACKAVSAAIEEFRNRPNRTGRARMFGERSIGLADPGMVALWHMLESLRQ